MSFSAKKLEQKQVFELTLLARLVNILTDIVQKGVSQDNITIVCYNKHYRCIII